jgi:hypothetical protein
LFDGLRHGGADVTISRGGGVKTIVSRGGGVKTISNSGKLDRVRSRDMSGLLRFAPCLMLVVVACGPRGKTGIPEGRDHPWAEMDESERMEHMATVVLPRMQAVFQAHDPERFADFGCATCHGSGAANGDFHMPSASLPVLDASSFYKKHRKGEPEMVRLMWKHVEPAMGEALAVTYGLGGGEIECQSCHVVENLDE